MKNAIIIIATIGLTIINICTPVTAVTCEPQLNTGTDSALSLSLSLCRHSFADVVNGLSFIAIEYEGVSYRNESGAVRAFSDCCNLCATDLLCDTWTYRSTPVPLCEFRIGKPLMRVNGTCNDGSCISGTKTGCAAGTKQQILDASLNLVVTAENFSGACYIIEHSFPAVCAHAFNRDFFAHTNSLLTRVYMYMFDNNR
jgi:hypothetical protein